MPAHTASGAAQNRKCGKVQVITLIHSMCTQDLGEIGLELGQELGLLEPCLSSGIMSRKAVCRLGISSW